MILIIGLIVTFVIVKVITTKYIHKLNKINPYIQLLISVIILLVALTLLLISIANLVVPIFTYLVIVTFCYHTTIFNDYFENRVYNVQLKKQN